MTAWIKMSLGMALGLGPGDFVLDGDPAPLPKRGPNPPFSATVRCAQTSGRTKMPLGMALGLGPGDFVLHGDPAPPPQKGGSPNFQPMFIVAKRLDG